MLSRRNIRIKVMQVLYAMSRDKDMTGKEGLQMYRAHIRQSFELYLLNLLQLIHTAEYAIQDFSIKSSKLRPSEEDRTFRPKLGKNELIDSLKQNKGFHSLCTSHKIYGRVTEDNSRILYNEFAKTDAYKAYLEKKASTIDDHRQILIDLYKSCIAGEMFNDIMEDNYISWTDDKSLVVGAMKKTLKALPAEGAFYEEFQPNDETVTEFGETLLKKVSGEDTELLELIEPTLKNWDADRVAIIDMILLKMAICELTSFPTVPTKVTLNEFVEISKNYSTDKSKDFINGILDRLMKKLNKEGKIVKEGRGLIEE
ncbi:MAG: transcription antitermination factor NusB [Lewinellaceae bacterium]|nr:transcription antitermination factor NusB [Saprospiraceae bacterium]MCB9339948.1 transcription antitermination factor NusB [Lewinellaceae bacterium]